MILNDYMSRIYFEIVGLMCTLYENPVPNLHLNLSNLTAPGGVH